MKQPDLLAYFLNAALIAAMLFFLFADDFNRIDTRQLQSQTEEFR